MSKLRITKSTKSKDIYNYTLALCNNSLTDPQNICILRNLKFKNLIFFVFIAIKVKSIFSENENLIEHLSCRIFILKNS